MSPRLAFALQAAYRAGRSTLAHFQAGAAVERKSDDTPVTIADREAERMIRTEIAAAFPQDAILGEEEGESGSGSERWVIDPIDGTKSFISGVPLYATLVAFEVEQVPQFGIAYFPALDEMIYAESGKGAFWNGRPCHVSSKTELAESVLSFGGPGSLVKYGRSEGFLDLSMRALATRTWSDAYGHMLVATGRIEAMVDPIVNRWDISAMSLIVNEAGGRCTNFAGDLGIYDEAVSTNGVLHQTILEAFR
jgi:histidinol-phosphatase